MKFCLLWMVVMYLGLSSAFDNISQYHHILLHWLQSMAFLAPFFHGLSLTSPVGLGLWLSMARVQDLGIFIWCRTGLSSWSYRFHSLLCTSLLIDWNSFSLQPVFSWWHTATPALSFWSDTHHCLDHADMYLWSEDLDNKTSWDWMMTRQALLVKSNRTIFPDAEPTSLHVGSAGILFTTCLYPWFHDFR